MKKILVITATLGNRSTLEKTILSVRQIASNRAFHVIVCPSKVIPLLKDKYPELTFLAEKEKDKGIYNALNYAFQNYGHLYEYMTFINDDDYWISGYSKLIEIIDKNPSIDVAYGRTLFVNEKDEFIGEQTSSPKYKAFKALLSVDIVLFTQQATLMKSELFFKLGGFDENYKLIADTKFWLDAIESGAKFKYTNSLCAAYTIQAGQLSSNGNQQKFEHERLKIEVNTLKGLYEKLLFRLYNSSIYIKRFNKFRGFKRMKHLFHTT